MSNRVAKRAVPPTVKSDGYRLVATRTPAPAVAGRPWWKVWAPKPAPAEPLPPELWLRHDCGWAVGLADGEVAVDEVAAAMGVHSKGGCRR